MKHFNVGIYGNLKWLFEELQFSIFRHYLHFPALEVLHGNIKRYLKKRLLILICKVKMCLYVKVCISKSSNNGAERHWRLLPGIMNKLLISFLVNNLYYRNALSKQLYYLMKFTVSSAASNSEDRLKGSVLVCFENAL